MIFDMTLEQLAPFERARSPWRASEEPKEPNEPDGADLTMEPDGSDRGGESGLEGRAMTARRPTRCSGRHRRTTPTTKTTQLAAT